ncbi:MAG: hypothetical protein ACI8RD_005208, partial [Bacillariaceae sp.]
KEKNNEFLRKTSIPLYRTIARDTYCTLCNTRVPSHSTQLCHNRCLVRDENSGLDLI